MLVGIIINMGSLCWQRCSQGERERCCVMQVPYEFYGVFGLRGQSNCQIFRDVGNLRRRFGNWCV